MTLRKYFYAISFIEGASVMATEIIGAKFLAPLFGSSLYVWSSVMAMTLGGLAGGYFFGGRLSQRDNKKPILYKTIFAASVFILLMPLIVRYITPLAFSLPLLPGVVISSCVILIPPVFCMGMVSPLIVQIISENSAESGKRAGEVYAISTVGGILATFLTGFYLIPNYGLSTPLFIFGGLMILCCLPYFIKGKNKSVLFIFVCVCVSSALNILGDTKSFGKILYSSDGMLGKLEVLEVDWNMDSLQAVENHRLLLVNNTMQTWIEYDSLKSYLKYVNQMEQMVQPCGKKIKSTLVLGLGGGAVANMLRKKGYAVTAVELDNRVIEVAQNYFGLDKSVDVINDDARHAIERMDRKFEYIVVDLFTGEVSPSHVVSKESLEKMKSLLAPGGIIFFNTYGYLETKAGIGNISLMKTLKHCGFNYRIGLSGEVNLEDYRNTLVIAGLSRPDIEVENEYVKNIDLDKGSLISDNFPVLEAQNAAAAKRWRYYYLRNFIKNRYN